MSNAPSSTFGTCWSCISDLTMPATMVSGNRAVAEAIIRRLTTPRGRLINDPNYGYDVTNLINDGTTPTQLAQAQKLASFEAKKDPRVIQCQVRIQLTGGVLIVTATPQLATGPFTLVFSLSNTPTGTAINLLQVTPS